MESRTMSCESRISGKSGKLRKMRTRKSKPYDLPSPSLATKSQGWLSKFVGGATRIVPFIFSSVYSLCFNDENNHSGNTEVDASQPELHDISPFNGTGNTNVEVSHNLRTTEDVIESSQKAHPNEVPESSKRCSKPSEVGKGKQILSSSQSEIFRIEQLIKGKKISRDEINHLIEILNSEKSDSHEAERGTKEIVTAVAVETGRPLWTRQGRPEDYNGAIPETPLPQLKGGDKIGASPIDLAKSFMRSRKLEPYATPYSVSVKAEETLQLIESATKPLMPSPSRASPMSSPHWPCIMVADQHGHVSPLTHKGRHGMDDFPRTPYYRTSYSNSRAKAKTKYDTLRDYQGSVGPIRRIRSKSPPESRSRGSIVSKPLVEVPSGSKILPVERSLESNDAKNYSDPLPVCPVPSGLEDSISFLTPSTSQAVGRILEHIHRSKPTPKKKAIERKPFTSLRFDELEKAAGSLLHVNKGKRSYDTLQDQHGSSVEPIRRIRSKSSRKSV